jgi:hypothetical protein
VKGLFGPDGQTRAPSSADYEAKTSKVEGINDDSPGGTNGRGATKSQAHEYSSHLSQLLNLKGHSIDSLRGREAEELGGKLHSVRSYILAPREQNSLTSLTVVFEKLYTKSDWIRNCSQALAGSVFKLRGTSFLL